MISAQQAYSAASQVITAVNKMFDTLISAVR
jgi:flagellar hook protein FlgE